MSDPDATADGGAAATPFSDAGPSAAAGWPPPAPPAGTTHKRRKWPVVLVVVAAVLLAGSWIASRVSVNYYVLTPGDATPVSQYIEVPAADNHPLTGKILLTDVYRHPAERAQLPAVPVLRLQQRGGLGARPARPDARREPVPGPGLPPDGPGPVATPPRPR